MVATEIKTLKASAFTLSKILKEYHLKLSSQQCLDVVSRLMANAPFEVVAAKQKPPGPTPAPLPGPRPFAAMGENPGLRSGLASRSNHIQRFSTTLARICRETRKAVQLHVDMPEATERLIAPEVWTRLSVPIEHVLRNAVIHGIERVPDRLAAGKTDHGNVHMNVTCENDQVVFVISDDGHGLDVEKAKLALHAQGLADDPDALEPAAIWALLCKVGVGTTDIRTDTAGHGMGLAYVKSAVERLGGVLQFESVADQGVVVTMRVPNRPA